MKRLFVGLICAFGIVNAQTVQDINSINAYSNDINAGSARYMGMGGAMGALGGDISSTEQNPAGIGLAIASDVNVALGVNTFNNKTNFGNSFKVSDDNFTLQNFGTTFVFNNNTGPWNRFSLGIKFSQEILDNGIGMGRNENIRATIPDETDPNLSTTYIMDGYQDIMLGHKSKLSFNLGASYQDRIYLGLGMNFHDTQLDNYVFFDEDTEGTVYRYDLNGTPYFSSGSGFSVSAGVIGKVNDALRLGLAYHSPAWYFNIDENFYADLGTIDHPDYDLYYSRYDRNSQHRLVASAGLIVGKSLALDADYTLHMNGSTKLKPSSDFANTNAFFDNNLSSSSEVRVGGEYRIDKFKVRAGYNYVQTPFKNLALNADLGDGNPGIQNFSKPFTGDINRFSVGLGYDFGGFYLDAAYQHQTQKFDYIFGGADYIDFDSADQAVYYASLPYFADYNYAANVKSNKGLFLLTAGWQF